MTWIRLDDDMPAHPKIILLSDAAWRLHVTGICHAGHYLTDGRVNAMQALPGVRPRAAEELVKAGLWIPDPDGGWMIHDYLDYNAPGEQIVARREADRLRKAKERAEGQA